MKFNKILLAALVVSSIYTSSIFCRDVVITVKNQLPTTAVRLSHEGTPEQYLADLESIFPVTIVEAATTKQINWDVGSKPESYIVSPNAPANRILLEKSVSNKWIELARISCSQPSAGFTCFKNMTITIAPDGTVSWKN